MNSSERVNPEDSSPTPPTTSIDSKVKENDLDTVSERCDELFGNPSKSESQHKDREDEEIDKSLSFQSIANDLHSGPVLISFCF